MRVSSTFLLSGNLIIAAAVFAVYWWRKRHLVRWAWFGWGALSWAAAVAAKGAFAGVLYAAFGSWLQAHPETLRGPAGWLAGGLLAGLLEVGLALAIARRAAASGAPRWGDAVAFGLGFGALEALLVGAFSFYSALVALTYSAWSVKTGNPLPQELHHYLLPGAPLLWAMVPVAERICLLFAHAAAGAWLLYAARTGRWGYFWAAFAYKSALGAMSLATSQAVDLRHLGGAWLVEACFAAFALLGWLGLRHLGPRYAALPPES